MATYTQTERPLAVTTPLGTDALLLAGFSGYEALSRLIQFRLDLLAENETEISFERLLGQKVVVSLRVEDGESRHYSGICSRISRGSRDAFLTSYKMEMVPQLWFLTRIAQSRIFQQVTVPDILRKVLQGIDVDYQLRGSYEPRDYCVQYRETDFAFVSRLMEEEGIFYFFVHSTKGHRMVVADSAEAFPSLPSPVVYDETGGGNREARDADNFVRSWEKQQELQTSKFTLWDHCFELPHKHLEAQEMMVQGVQAGEVFHKLRVGSGERLEVYDYPGAYAQRFDGIDPGGGDRSGDLQKIFQDNKRTVGLRMQEQASGALVISGEGVHRRFVSGAKFGLERHFDADGQYLLTSVEHEARDQSYRSGMAGGYEYTNRFTCIPAGLPYRPARTTPRPVIHGTQTAVVVGPAGEEIFTDKYGRVKVQFHWDRQGKNDSGSSCWVRVGTIWAGKQWGAIHIPRIGQEVVVAFEEGDPDRPIIVGSVYNADMMPPYKLPDMKTQSGIKSRSTLNGTVANFNEIRFEDKKGEEELYIHAEKDRTIVVENDEKHSVGHDRQKSVSHDETTSIGNDRTESVGQDETIQIGRNRAESVDKNETITIGQNRNESVGKDETVSIGANHSTTIGKDDSRSVGANQAVSVKKNQSVEIGGTRATEVAKDDTLNVGKNLTMTAGDQIILNTGDASIILKKNGDILIKGKNIKIDGSGKIQVVASSDVTIKGSKIKEN